MYNFSRILYLCTMKRENPHQIFEVILHESDDYIRSRSDISFFEIVYIVSGSGIQTLNEKTFEYGRGNMFLTTPEDIHSFKVYETTVFLIIRFNDMYVRSNARNIEQIRFIEYILTNVSHQPGCVLKNLEDGRLIPPLIKTIIKEHGSLDFFAVELVYQAINMLIIFISRSIARALPKTVGCDSEKRILDIIQYVQENIRNPEMLGSENIARHFAISKSYLGRYFKKHTNETLQQYILAVKLKLVENRLIYSDMRINEIVAEFNFTDESHLNKLFRRFKGVGPSEYRKRKRVGRDGD